MSITGLAVTGLCIPEAMLPVRNNGSEEPLTGCHLALPPKVMLWITTSSEEGSLSIHFIMKALRV
ncbi:hypothetical protein [Aeropyrum pernix]|uniref:hypothetical protein n=1 Tax=Aeropyrum pernix TaxID=56636 RepID=UPI0013051D3E|nr:hypothetical protein [Aeropyrum pernix]